MSKRMKRLGLAATLVTMTLVAGAVTTVVAQDDDDDDVFTVVERATTDLVVDLGDEGDSLGDLLVWGNELYDEANQTVVGRDQGSCVRSNPGLSWECTWTNILEDGSIVVQGPFYDDLRESVLAVTGGTGAYVGAEGTMTVTALDADGDVLAFRFDLDDDGDDGDGDADDDGS